jgi:2-deoxy-D-gluconate 3-dehydrogenase
MKKMKPLSKLLDLKGKTAIVTGGAKGIGFGICYRLAEAGAQVFVVDIDEDGAEKAAHSLRNNDWSAEAMSVDVSDDDAVQKMIEVCSETFGSVDILVNNAGIYPPKPIQYMSKEEFEKVIHVNLRSVFLTTKYASDVMKSQGGGKIINITSIDAVHPSMVGLAHYDASKHGVWGFTKNAALELAPFNIWVNAIAPGGIQTPGVEAMQSLAADKTKEASDAFLSKIPMHRMGESDEIGKVTLFLASEMSSYMTGEQIVVDGGALLS